MIFYRLILLIIIGVFAGFYGFSKCPDYYFIVSKIQQIEQKKNKNIDDLHKIEVSWNVCNYPKDSTYGLLLLAKLNNYFEIGQYEKCIPFGKETLTILSKTDTKVSSLPKVYFTIAYSYFSLKEYEYAKEFFMKVVRNSKVKQHQTLELDSYFYLANLFQQEGDYQLAYQNITYALNLATKINDKFFIADIWREKANIERQLGNYKGAVVSLDNALKYALGYKDKEKIARVYELKGRVYEKLNDYKVAIESYKNALQILGSLNKTLQTTINTNIGYLYSIKQEKYDLALFYFEKALKLSVDSYQRLGIYDNIAYAYTKKRDFEQAIKFYQLAYKEVIHRFNERGNENPSPEFIKKLIKKKNILTLIKDKADTWLESYKTNSKISDLKHALDTYLLADNLITFMRWEQTGEETKLFWREKTHKMYESAIETCSLIKDYSNAFYFFEKSRAVLLNDKLNELGAKQNLSNEDKKYEIELQSKIEDLRKKLSDKNSNIETLEKELFLAEDTQEKFIKSLETKNPTYYQLKYETKIADLKAVQNYLKEIGGGSLVEYFLGDSTTYAIIVSSNSVAIKKLNYDKNVAQKFLNECSKRLTTKTELIEFNKLSYQVFQNLVEPLNLPKGRVIISQDGVFLPFEALSKVANKAEFIVNDYMISYTYSAQFLLKNREKKGFLPNRTFIGFAPVNFTQKLNPLVGSDKSLDEISQNYFWNTKLTGSQVTKKSFLENAQKYQIVQVYTHAFADSNETEPRIYFADSTLKVSELGLQDQFKTNLLVLAACRTGVGKVAKGEGVLSLARGFSMLGIPATITSLWSVEDKDTYVLTELFYKYLNEGLAKDEALQKAKIEFSQQNLSPNAWAGLVLIGDSTKVETNNLYLWIVVFVLGALCLIFFISKRPKKTN